MGKKIKSVMEAEEEKFVAGCVAQGYTEQVGTEIFGADRALRRIRLQPSPTAPLRTGGLSDRLPEGPLPGRVHGGAAHRHQAGQGPHRGLPVECRQMGIEVLVPDVNESESTSRFTRRPSGSASRRCATSARAWWRRSSRRAPTAPSSRSTTSSTGSTLSVLNKRTVESLIKAGAFDGLGLPQGADPGPRADRSTASGAARNEEMGQYSLFAGEVGLSEYQCRDPRSRVAVEDKLWRSRRRCWVCTSPIIRCWGGHGPGGRTTTSPDPRAGRAQRPVVGLDRRDHRVRSPDAGRRTGTR
jgi:DNA polymerase III subunit alpha